MFTTKLKEEVNTRFIKNNKIVPKSVVSEKHKEFIQKSLLQETTFLDSINPTIAQRIYHVLNNIHKIPRCSEGNPVSYKNAKLGYTAYCSNQKCKCKKDYVTKREHTCIEKYRVTNPSKAEIIRDKKKETCQKNFGVDTNFMLDTIQTKINNTKNLTLKDDFFDLNNLQNLKNEVTTRFIPYTKKLYLKNEYKEFILTELLPIFNYLDTNNIQQVIWHIINFDYTKKLCLDNNEINFISIEKGYRQICNKKDCIPCREKLSTIQSNTSKSLHLNRTLQEREQIKLKRINTYFNKNGVYNPSYKNLKDILPLIKSTDFWKQFKSYEEIKDYFIGKVSPSSILNFTHRYRPDLEIFNTNVSYPHKVINQYLTSLNMEYNINIRSVISPVELDIFIPKHNLAIEINGVFWHTEIQGKDKHYHLNKLNKCIDKDIKLLHLTDIDILNKTDIVFNLIKDNLDLNKEVNVNECTLVDLDKETCIDFIKENSLFEYTESNVHKGLLYQNKLVSVLCLNENDNIFEVTNYTDKLSYIIKNSLSLLTNDIKGKFIVYVDRNYFSGNKFKNENWKLIDITNAECYYTKDSNVLYHNNDLNNDTLCKLLSEYNNELSIDDNMLNNNYNKFCNCGYKVFTYTNI